MRAGRLVSSLILLAALLAPVSAAASASPALAKGAGDGVLVASGSDEPLGSPAVPARIEFGDDGTVWDARVVLLEPSALPFLADPSGRGVVVSCSGATGANGTGEVGVGSGAPALDGTLAVAALPLDDCSLTHPWGTGIAPAHLRFRSGNATFDGLFRVDLAGSRSRATVSLSRSDARLEWMPAGKPGLAGVIQASTVALAFDAWNASTFTFVADDVSAESPQGAATTPVRLTCIAMDGLAIATIDEAPSTRAPLAATNLPATPARLEAARCGPISYDAATGRLDAVAWETSVGTARVHLGGPSACAGPGLAALTPWRSPSLGDVCGLDDDAPYSATRNTLLRILFTDFLAGGVAPLEGPEAHAIANFVGSIACVGPVAQVFTNVCAALEG